MVLLDDRVFSHHASDVIADGHGHDSFDLLRILEHGGDARDAARSAALELGLDSAVARAAGNSAALTGSYR